MTVGISGGAGMVAGLKSDGPWSGMWNYTYSNSELGAITLDNAFNIEPSNQPSPGGMKALSASAQEHCTSYINYRAPTVYSWSTAGRYTARQHIDGLYLGYTPGYSNPNFGPNNKYDTWYLGCSGTLEAFTTPDIRPMGGSPGQKYEETECLCVWG